MTATIIFVLTMLLPLGEPPKIAGAFHAEEACNDLGHALTQIVRDIEPERGKQMSWRCDKAILAANN